MGRAISYVLNQPDFVARFLEHPKVGVDTNASEGAQRIIALGRHDCRWVGHDESGDDLAVLQTSVATCIANDVNAHHYTPDVLLRLQTHPVSEIDALLPVSRQPTS